MSASLIVYRDLLRSAARAFKGDVIMATAARGEIRSKFEASRVVSDAAEVQQLQADGRETAEFLRNMVMQVPVNDRGNIEMVVEQEHTNKFVEPIEPGMDLPRERKKKAAPSQPVS